MLKFLPALALLVATSVATAAESWETLVAKAQGQTVYWNAWAGDEKINAYIDWAGDQVEARYGVTVKHVKLTDTAEAVSRVVAEKAAGRNAGGSVDLIWINGENFAAMKREGLLFGPWAEQLPNFSLVDTVGKPTTLIDFTVPVEGLEAPWGMAQIVFMVDSAQVPQPPRTIAALSDWAKAHPGRFTYPQPPNFLGSTFLKQALIELTDSPDKLQQPVADDAEFAAVTAPLWPYLDALNPVLWRSGKVFPQNGPAQRRLLGDGEIDIAISFSPAEASSAIANNELPDTVRTFVLEWGTIGNTNFVAIPYNANAKEGAMVLANFLLSPEAQVRKQDPTYWGGLTVLDLSKLSVEDRARFDALELGVATLSPAELGKTLLEPHPSWMERIEAEWQRRYATGG
jgi:putative thiamine transport system substrate-binding protein